MWISLSAPGFSCTWKGPTDVFLILSTTDISDSLLDGSALYIFHAYIPLDETVNGFHSIAIKDTHKDRCAGLLGLYFWTLLTVFCFLLLYHSVSSVCRLTHLSLPSVTFFSLCCTYCFLYFIFPITCGISVEVFFQSILLLLFVNVNGCRSWPKSMSKMNTVGAEIEMGSQLKQNSSH